MSSITVKLPDDQKKEIQRLVEEKNYPNMSEWVRETIRQRIEEQQKLQPEELKKLELADSIASKSELTAEDVEEIGEKVKEGIAEKHDVK